MKKLFLVLVLCLCSLASLAEVGDTISVVAPSGQTLYYKITSPTTVEVVPPAGTLWTGFTKPTGSLTIPSSVSYGGTPYSVTTIGDYAFEVCRGLTSVNIPNSVTTIGNHAFGFCNNLTSVNIPNSVTTIGNQAFEFCYNLTSVVIPNRVTAIKNFTFNGCSSLTSVTIPNSVTSIGNHAFDGCSSLTSVTIPDSVTSIGNYAFYGCSSLTSVVIPNSVTSLGICAFDGCSSLASVTISNSVTTIGDHTFYGCSGLTSVVIPESVTSIGIGAFYGCSSLASVTISNSVTTIGSHTFYGCSGLTSVVIPESVTSIGNSAFDGCSSLTSVTIPDSVTSIGNGAFYDCSGLTSVTIGESVTTIENGAFAGCSNVTTLNYNAKNLTTTAEWYNASEDKNTYGFRPMSLQTLVIGDDVETLPQGVFYGQSGLTSITIPNSVTTIGNNAFYGCSNVSTLYYNATNLSGLGDLPTDGFRPMPLQTLVIGDNVETLPDNVFCYQRSLTGSLTIPESVTSIGVSAFQGCTGLTNVTLPNSVTSIGSSTFFSCSGLTSAIIPESVTRIEDQTFAGCVSLTDVTLPNSVTSIGNNAFADCSGLTHVTFPNSLTAIGDNAFQNCTGLANVTIGNSVNSIGASAFGYCTGLASIVIGKSVNSIGLWAFDGCASLKTIYNLSENNINQAQGTIDFGCVALNAKRVLSKNNGFSDYGTGSNTLHQISTDYSIVDVADDVETNIPRSTIPTNFIYYDNGAKDGSGWKANEIFLTDDTNRFVAPEEFTAEKATYSREFTNSNRSTLCLPFTAAVPEGFEVYDFAGFDGHTLTFFNHEGDIAAYTPYLVDYNLSKEGNITQCTITHNDALFPQTSAATPACTTTYNDMTFKGTTVRTCMTDNNYGYKDGFFVRSARGTADDHGSHAHVNPFRCYFAYTAPAGSSQPLPQTLNVEVGYGDPLGIDAVETPEQEYDNRYGNDVYDMLGRLVRKNAENLDGLPKGVYIWKGKKIMNYDL